MIIRTNHTVAELQYLDHNAQQSAYFASVAGGKTGTYEGNYIKVSVQVDDGRDDQSVQDLDGSGFKLTRQLSKVRDFYADTEIQTLYENEVKQLVIQHTGAKRVEIFDHTRRAATEELRKEKKLREVASVIHNDYTPISGPKRLREILPDEADTLLERRFAIINVWRSINGSISNYPLTLCDARTVSADDLIEVERKSAERIGAIQLSRHSTNHRWIYFPNMQMDEAILFKTYDSATDGRTRFTIHSSFDDPNAPADAAPRESMETRCFVFF